MKERDWRVWTNFIIENRRRIIIPSIHIIIVFVWCFFFILFSLFLLLHTTFGWLCSWRLCAMRCATNSPVSQHIIRSLRGHMNKVLTVEFRCGKMEKCECEEQQCADRQAGRDIQVLSVHRCECCEHCDRSYGNAMENFYIAINAHGAFTLLATLLFISRCLRPLCHRCVPLGGRHSYYGFICFSRVWMTNYNTW